MSNLHLRGAALDLSGGLSLNKQEISLETISETISNKISKRNCSNHWKTLNTIVTKLKSILQNQSFGDLRKVTHLINNKAEVNTLTDSIASKSSFKSYMKTQDNLIKLIDTQINLYLRNFPQQQELCQLTDIFLKQPEITYEARDIFFEQKKGAGSYTSKELLIVGAGPAGLMSAYEAVSKGQSVTLLESRSEETFDVRPGIMHLNNQEVIQKLKDILNRDFDEDDIFSHTHNDPLKKGIEHRKSKQQLLNELEKPHPRIQTKVIQRILFEAIKKRSNEGDIVCKFNSNITAVDGRSQTVMHGIGHDQKLIGFNDIIFADGTAIFKQLNEGVVDCKNTPPPRAILMSSIGTEDKVSVNPSNVSHGKQYSQGAFWLKINAEQQELFQSFFAGKDPSCSKATIDRQIQRYESHLDSKKIKINQIQIEIEQNSKALQQDPENQSLIAKKNDLETNMTREKALIDKLINPKLEKLKIFSNYKFYIDFTKDKSKFWFAGNVPPKIHGEKNASLKLNLMKTFIKELLVLSHPKFPKEITSESLTTSEESRSEESKLARTPKQIASDKVKQGMTWEMGHNDPNSGSSLKQLDDSFIVLPSLHGTAQSMGDASYMPSFYKGEGTNTAMNDALEFNSINLEDELSQL